MLVQWPSLLFRDAVVSWGIFDGAMQSLHLDRIGLAFLSKLLPYYGREGTFLEEILCAKQMRCSTREPCRHHPVPGVVREDTGIQKAGWQGGIKEKQKWQSNGFSSESHQPSFSQRTGSSEAQAWLRSQEAYVFIPGLG